MFPQKLVSIFDRKKKKKKKIYIFFLDLKCVCLANSNICLKTLYKTCTCLKILNRYLSYKTDTLFYQTRNLSLPNRLKQST